ncbi:MAG: FAD-dependent oxidoreductase [Candidatus Promineifilaceae bacterium]|nr:FAD-dependent oxidoreductase [Candidatus Promineifilaceae bacterium]
MNQTADVIIIGAGIIGCATAFELAKRGYQTLNIDKLPGAGHGSTSNSCALIRFFYSTWEGVAMSYEGYHYWKDWSNYIGVSDERGLASYTERGTIMLMTEGHDHENVIGLYDQIGVRYEVWDTVTLKEKMPIYDVHAFWPPRSIDDPEFWEAPDEMLEGAVFTPQSGYVNDPLLATYNLFLAARAQGSDFLFNHEVTEIRRAGGRVQGVTLEDGQQIDAPVVVNVAGPHSFVVNRMAEVEGEMNIKTRALRHEVHHVPAPPGFNFERHGHPTSDGDAGTYFRPEVGNKIAVGTEDPECDPKEYVADPDSFVYQVTPSHWKRQVYRLARRIPDLPIPNQPMGVADMYDVSDDWLPVYDRSSLPGYYMAIGTSGNQFKNAGIAGLMMAEIIDACEKGHDHDRDPVRVAGPYTGLTLNAGFYSRLRQVNPESTLTVRG